MRKARKRVLSALLAAVLALGLMPSVAFAGEGDGPTPFDGPPTASGTYFFANGTPITITETAPEKGIAETFDDFTAKGTDAYISWAEDDTIKYVGVNANESTASKAYVFGGADGRQNAVSVENTSITMTGGTVYSILGGNLGQENNTQRGCSTVEGNVDISVTGGSVTNLIYGGGENNTCVNGTVTIELSNATLGASCYVNGGVLGHGPEGTRNIEDGTMTTFAVVSNVEISAENSSAFVIGGGGSGSTKVKSASVTLNNCTIGYLYASGINGEMETSSLVATGCRITEELAATNRGFIGTATVTLEDCDVKQLMTGATTGCFETDSGTPDGSGITGAIEWKIDDETQVEKAVFTPLAMRDASGTITATFNNLTIEKEGNPLQIAVDAFEPHTSAQVKNFQIPEGSTLTLSNVQAEVSTGQTLANAGTIDMDDKSSLTVASNATFEQVGTVKGAVVNDGGTIKTDYAARIGTTGYQTLESAIDAATSGATVTLLKDVYEKVEVDAGDNINLELNGHWLIDNVQGSPAALTNNGTIVIQDSVGTGGIKRLDNPNTNSYYTIKNEGTMTITGGTVYNDSGSITGWKGSSLICNGASNNATLNISGGTFQQDNFIAVKNDEKGTLNITGGTIISDTQAVQNWCIGNISGGEMIGDVTTWAYQGYDGETTISGDAYIKGDVIAGWFNGGGYEVDKGIEPEVSITGGTVTGTIYKATATTTSNTTQVNPDTEGATINVTGGNFGKSVDENFLDNSLKAELKSAANPEAPFSYFTTMQNALALAKPGDSVTAVNEEEGRGYFTLTLDYNDGDATDDSTYTVESGTAITLPAPTRAGYTFQGWYDESGAKVESPYTVTANATLTAVWSANATPAPTPEQFDVAVADVQNGAVELSAKTAKEGQKVTVTVTPDLGWELAQLTVADEDGDALELTENADGTYSFTMPAGDVTVHASFADAWENPFTDLSEDHWGYGAVRTANLLGLMKGIGGTTLFGPDDGLLREQAATVMWNLMGAGDVSRPEAPQADVDQSQWYAPYVNWAVDSKVMDGYSEDDFGVGDSLTREQFAAVVAKAVGADVDSADQAALGAFPDADGVSGWARATMAWAVEAGVLNGVGTEDGSRELQATRELTRAEMATMMVNAIEVGVLDFGA